MLRFRRFPPKCQLICGLETPQFASDRLRKLHATPDPAGFLLDQEFISPVERIGLDVLKNLTDGHSL